jgi:metallo-beta-lactamase class B
LDLIFLEFFMPRHLTHSSRFILDRRTVLTLLGATAVKSLLPTSLRAAIDPDWTTPMPPFRIAGNLYYVGSRDLASYLITTPQGHILINSNLLSSPPQIRASVEKLGFRWKEVKILLISHAHYDHCAGSAGIFRETNAKYTVMDADVPVVESGGKTDFLFGNRLEFLYPPAKVSRILHDSDTITLGETTLTAHKTPGHTKGCTTWTTILKDGGKSYNTVIVGSPNINPGQNLVNDPKYPQMAADYAACFRTLQSLPCDIFLGAHGGYFDLLAKYPKLKTASTNPFVDPTGYINYVTEREQAFEKELAKQRAHPLRVHD